MLHQINFNFNYKLTISTAFIRISTLVLSFIFQTFPDRIGKWKCQHAAIELVKRWKSTHESIHFRFNFRSIDCHSNLLSMNLLPHQATLGLVRCDNQVIMQFTGPIICLHGHLKIKTAYWLVRVFQEHTTLVTLEPSQNPHIINVSIEFSRNFTMLDISTDMEDKEF